MVLPILLWKRLVSISFGICWTGDLNFIHYNHWDLTHLNKCHGELSFDNGFQEWSHIQPKVSLLRQSMQKNYKHLNLLNALESLGHYFMNSYYIGTSSMKSSFVLLLFQWPTLYVCMIWRSKLKRCSVEVT